ncbi:MAG: hypothetical protein Q9217_005321 [Psora testacea]
MASSLTWLTTLKSAQLKSLAIAIGVNSSGTKPALVTQLQNHLPRSAYAASGDGVGKDGSTMTGKQEGQNIISIDMGIRNLAYCRLHLPPRTARMTRTMKLSISEWSRINISAPTAPDTADYVDGPKSLPTEAKEPFDLSTYAARAYKLLHSLLYLRSHAARPTHILIERQRFRSMGGSAVQEWTLRVNTFEAMLYAVLEALRREGTWEGNVVGVSPARVGRFWLGEGEVEYEGLTKGKGKATTRSARTKMLKVQLVGRWLEGKGMFSLKAEAKSTAEQYMRKLQGKGRQEKFGKLDDLADCLLQGMAWLKWEENRRLVWERGEDALKELERH